MILVFAVLTVLLCACGAQEDAALPSPTVSASSSAPGSAAAAIPAPSPPTAQPEGSAAPSASAEPSATLIGRVVCVAGEYVNIREKPGTDSPVVGTFPAGETAGVLEYTDGWALISYKGATGYVSRDYIVANSEPDVSVPAGDWAAILVNPTNLLPDDFSVELADFEGGQVDGRILEVCEEMFRDAEKDEVTLSLVDAYRSYDRQNELYLKKVESYIAKGLDRAAAEAEAATITARPDTSEHQTGLALDIVTPFYTSRDKGFAETKAFAWLNANAQNYGFTLRYKQDKAEFTKVIYEPWHWRFVGVQAAEEMKKTGQCLEEYLGILD